MDCYSTFSMRTSSGRHAGWSNITVSVQGIASVISTLVRMGAQNTISINDGTLEPVFDGSETRKDWSLWSLGPDGWTLSVRGATKLDGLIKGIVLDILHSSDLVELRVCPPGTIVPATSST